MKWKNRLTNYNFWISIISAGLLILQAFHLKFDVAYINEIMTAVLGLLVVVGIISDPTKSTESNTNISTQTSPEETKENDIPITKEGEDFEYINKDDIQILINKIAEDLNNIKKDISSSLSSSLKEEEINNEDYNIENKLLNNIDIELNNENNIVN